MTYYTLAIRENGRWAPMFGDFDRDVVEEEREAAYDAVPRGACRILATGDTQAEIDAAVAALNARRV